MKFNTHVLCYVTCTLVFFLIHMNSLQCCDFSTKICCSILEKKTDPLLVENKITPLHSAILLNDKSSVLKIIKELKSEKQILNAQNAEGNSALHFAFSKLCFYRFFLNNTLPTSSSISKSTKRIIFIIKALLEKGADVGLKNHNDQTILYLAAMAGDSDLVELLMKKGAEDSEVDTFEKKPLYISTLCGNYETTKKLFKITKLSKKNQAELLVAAAKSNNLSLVTFFIENGCDIAPALIETAKLSVYTPLNLLFKKIGFRTDICNAEKSSLLAISIEHNSEEVFHYLLSRHYPLNTMDANCRTPLHIAALKKNINFARFLLINGADNLAKDCNGKIPSDYDTRIKNLTLCKKTLNNRGF